MILNFVNHTKIASYRILRMVYCTILLDTGFFFNRVSCTMVASIQNFKLS